MKATFDLRLPLGFAMKISAAVLVAGSALSAQVAPAPTAAVTRESVVVLSPFEVTTDKDTGFVASSALAGGRLNLELKDVAAAYSVITRDFIDALGLTSMTEAAEWAPNSMRSVDGSGGGDTFNNPTPVTTRGVGNVYQLRQRNFFVYFAPNDSYAIERYDFGRGPNQVLFGNGTVGGQSVSMTKRARFDRPFDTLELTGGSWSNFRSVVDVNRPLGEKFAARASAVWADRDGWRMGEHEATKAVFATLSFKPTKKSELRLEGEVGSQSRRIPYATLNDNFSGWDGVTVFNGRADTLPANAAALGVDRRGSNYFVYNPQAGLVDAIYTYQNQPITRGGGATNTTPIGGFVQVGTQSMNTSGASLLHAVNVPANRFDTALARSRFTRPTEQFTLAPTSSNSNQKYRDVQLTFSQQFGANVFVELAGDINRTSNLRDMLEQSGIANTYIDISRTLPNGAPNPKFLVPYGEAGYRYSLTETEAESVRAAFAYIKDLGRWGHYSFNVMTGLTHRLAVNRNDFPHTGIPALTDRRLLGNDAQAIKLRQYWDEPSSQPRPPATVNYIDPINPANNRSIQPFWALALSSFNNLYDNEENYNYALVAMNAKFFRDRLVILAAVRRDDSKQVVDYTRLPGDYPLDWDGRTVFMRAKAPADWGKLSYVPKNAAGQPTGPATLAVVRPRSGGNNQYQSPLPQYANDRFQDDFSPPDAVAKNNTPSVGTVLHVTSWMSLAANYAKAFAFNASAAPDPNSQLMPPAKGQGWDATVRFTLLDRKVDFSAGYYANEENGNYIDPTSVTNAINGLYGANVVGDLSEDGRNVRGGVNMSSVTRDTRTRIADGFEFIVTANPGKAWRLTANYALPKVWNKNFAPITRAYVAQRADFFRQILTDAGGLVGADGRAVPNPAIPAVTAIDQTNAVNNYNNIYTNLANFLPDMQLDQFQPIGNAYVDYTVQEGPAKGFRVGAGVNYRGKARIGYRGGDTIVSPTNAAVSIDNPNVDGHNTVWAPDYFTATVTASHRWRLQDRRELSFNLRVNNLLNNRDVIYTGSTTRPLGGDFRSPARETVPSAFAYRSPVSFSLTLMLRM